MSLLIYAINDDVDNVIHLAMLPMLFVLMSVVLLTNAKDDTLYKRNPLLVLIHSNVWSVLKLIALTMSIVFRYVSCY